MISEAKKIDLEKQGYRLVGNHSAIKVCLWTKRAIRAEDECYKKTFYGINTHRCVQMTPALLNCSLRCQWCWRDIDHTKANWIGPVDEPIDIIDGCMAAQNEYLQGFGGNEKADKDVYAESLKPKHFAISLAGEPTYYPKIKEFIIELDKRDLTSFLVTNGTLPEQLELLKEAPITQLYVTVPAPDEDTFVKVCNPLIKDAWQRIQKSLSLLKDFKCRKVIRLTLAKDVNMIKPEKYAEIIQNASGDFVEVKAYMWVGYSQKRLKIENMATHEEILEFAKKLAEFLDWKIVDEKPNSRVVLLMKEDRPDRIMKF